MSSYYKVLGLAEGAKEEQVKKAYRRLAMEFHPDKNESDEAMARFIQITEAYESLQKGITEPQEKMAMPSPPTGDARRHDPEWRKKVAERLRQAKIRAAGEGLQYYHDYLKSYKYKLSLLSAIAAVLMAITISVDYFTPGDIATEKVFNMDVALMVNDYDNGVAMHDYYIFFSPDQMHQVSYDDYVAITPGEELAVERSVLFKEPLDIIRTTAGSPVTVNFEHFLYSLYYVIMVVLMLPLLRFRLQKPDVSYYFFDFAVRSAFPVLMAAILYALIV
jgi:hypothetical protein